MSQNSKRPRKPLELFLDDGFSNFETAGLLRAADFVVHEFLEAYPRKNDPAKRQEGIVDDPIIRHCHENSWLLVTTDKEMCKKHCATIRKCRNSTILATAHNGSCLPSEWVDGLIKLKQELEHHVANTRRPWFMFFSREGKITATRDRIF